MSYNMFYVTCDMTLLQNYLLHIFYYSDFTFTDILCLITVILNIWYVEMFAQINIVLKIIYGIVQNICIKIWHFKQLHKRNINTFICIYAYEGRIVTLFYTIKQFVIHIWVFCKWNKQLNIFLGYLSDEINNYTLTYKIICVLEHFWKL